MDEQKVIQFAQDTLMRESIETYFKGRIDTNLLERAYSGEDISGAKLAMELITSVFNQLSIDYGPKLNNQTTANTSR